METKYLGRGKHILLCLRDEVKNECYQEIVMAALSLKNALSALKIPKKARKFTVQMEQLT
jgi:hypothetical protein